LLFLALAVAMPWEILSPPVVLIGAWTGADMVALDVEMEDMLKRAVFLKECAWEGSV
jgi:hypothetical protein